MDILNRLLTNFGVRLNGIFAPSSDVGTSGTANGEMPLGRLLKNARERRGISQSTLARLVGMKPNSISKLESNCYNGACSVNTLRRIAKALDAELHIEFQDKRKAAYAERAARTCNEAR